MSRRDRLEGDVLTLGVCCDPISFPVMNRSGTQWKHVEVNILGRSLWNAWVGRGSGWAPFNIPSKTYFGRLDAEFFIIWYWFKGCSASKLQNLKYHRKRSFKQARIGSSILQSWEQYCKIRIMQHYLLKPLF